MFQNLDMSAMMKKQVDRMFKRVDNAVWDLMTGSVGIVRDGSVLTRGPLEFIDPDTKLEADFQVCEQLFEAFSMPIPAYAQITSRAQVQLGDMVVLGNGNIGWVKKINPKSYRILTSSGTTTDWSPTKIQTMGMGASDDGIMVVRSLLQMGTTAGGDGSANLMNLQSSLLPLMMMGGDGDAIGDMLPMMLMMNMSGAGGNMAGMMPMMMMANMMKGGKSPFSK